MGNGFNGRVTYRFWFYFCKTAPPTMILGWIGISMLDEEPGEGVMAHLTTIWTVVFAVLAVTCLWKGLSVDAKSPGRSGVSSMKKQGNHSTNLVSQRYSSFFS